MNLNVWIVNFGTACWNMLKWPDVLMWLMQHYRPHIKRHLKKKQQMLRFSKWNCGRSIMCSLWSVLSFEANAQIALKLLQMRCNILFFIYLFIRLELSIPLTHYLYFSVVSAFLHSFFLSVFYWDCKMHIVQFTY